MMRVAEYFDGRFKSVGERWFSQFVGCGLWFFATRGMQMCRLEAACSRMRWFTSSFAGCLRRKAGKGPPGFVGFLSGLVGSLSGLVGSLLGLVGSLSGLVGSLLG